MKYEMCYRENSGSKMNKFTGDKEHLVIAFSELIEKSDSINIKIKKLK